MDRWTAFDMYNLENLGQSFKRYVFFFNFFL